MDCYATLILLCFGLSLDSCSPLTLRRYHYVNLKMSWSEAQSYCRAKYTDLATIESMDDISRLKPTFPYTYAWIGLEDNIKSWKVAMGNDTNSWKWSATGETSKTGYKAWYYGEPTNGGGREMCVIMNSQGLWVDVSCHLRYPFVCYTVTKQNEETYAFVPTLKSWEYAQEYCRTHHTDLATIENAAQNTRVYSAKSAVSDAWIGVSRVAWTWSDKSQSSFRFWDEMVPDNLGRNQNCAVENNQHRWNDDVCQYKFPFICHEVLKLKKTVVKMKIQTTADLTDPAVRTQLLQQLDGVLRRQSWTDFKLQLRIQPRK